ncbi:ABC transporter permease [Roseiconus lacunae]|uniref:ABC transporter permease n=1 Tax=Roseiconus lacunae TaxID=2605694 RepID=A0ABT7PC33_9BACT|nr:ABC transporter permease subunit [Roseiconus lacunae]MDM4013943.1 ABC transporter permease [Roseiconus lacunae]WRQ53239.1 ABC transporter permease subunit [Stieleria sp. HD01]
MSLAVEQQESPVSFFADWLDSLDRRCERFGDAINPILVKETRQSLKSRQFVVTFSLILFAALAWTVAGSLSMMPQIYTSPSAPRMMIGYYAVLALPMMLVVPLAAYRSLESEIDDGTLELLSITTLSPWQIVLGKLFSAMLQMLLYFVTLFPCLAYAYSLRGVDLPTTLLIIGSLAVAGMVLTVMGLFFAPVSKGRGGRVMTMLVLIIVLLLAEYGVSAMVIGMVFYGNPLTTTDLVFTVLATVAFAIAASHLMLTATAAQLTPETENRSTAIRLSLLGFTVVCVTISAASLVLLEQRGIGIYMISLFVLSAIWTISGAMMVSESDTMTPRIRRELPQSFLARLMLTWLTPGPATGTIFAITCIGLLTVLQQLSVQYIANTGIARGTGIGRLNAYIGDPGLLYASYVVGYLVIVRVMMWAIRLRNNPRVEIGLAAFVVVAVLAALLPYSLQLHYYDYQQISYDPAWQITNWAFTLFTALDQGLPAWQVHNIVGGAICLSLMAVFASWKATRPRTIATPENVRKELGL